MTYIESFLLNQFQDFSPQIITEICKYLPSEYISEWILCLPKQNILRQIMIEHYYSKELHFILSPTRRPHFCIALSNLQLKELIDFNNYAEIEDFLIENNDIKPNLIKLITGGDFESLKELINKFKNHYFQYIANLEIQIESFELSNDQLNYITSILPENTTKLQFTGIKLNNCSKELKNGCFSRLKNLRNLIILGHSITDWKDVSLPENLNHIDISWNNSSNIKSLSLPKSIKEIFWNQAGINSFTFNQMNLPENLTTLMLTYNNISSFDINKLPETLETIDLSYNVINSFRIDSATSWPTNLKTVLLSHNAIDNDTLLKLSQFKWPQFLKNLKLDNNPFSSLKNLINLPDNLTYLNLSENSLKSLEIEPYNENLDVYPFFKFPNFLDSLDLSNSPHLVFDDYKDQSKRIRFPSTLSNLNLSECNISDLSVFQFPESLKKLSLTGNHITDLTTYNNSTSFNWLQLVNLTELELYFNEVENLENWLVPPNLRKLDMRLNKFTTLTSFRTPLFNKIGLLRNKTSLQVINVGQNKIKKIDSKIQLPKNLISLSVNDNELSDLRLPLGFIHNTSLQDLDLSDNNITRFDESLNNASEISSITNLKRLDLTGNKLLKERESAISQRSQVNNFYVYLEKTLNKSISKRKFNVNSVHIF